MIYPSGSRVPPQLSRSYTTQSIMLDVLVALLPAWAMSIYLFGPRVIIITAISIASCVLSEYGYRKITGKSQTIHDLSAVVTGLLLAMCLPVAASYWAPILGGCFAIILVKQFYGGLGGNFMNPALAGRMLLCTFPHLMTTWTDALHWPPILGSIDALSAATPMSYLSNDMLPPFHVVQMLMGQHGGSIGEVPVLMLLLGCGYLIFRGVISPRIPVSFLGTVALITFFTPHAGSNFQWMMAHLCSGGLVLGACFMATDYTTSPVTPKGQIFYGIGCGLFTVLLRYYGSYPDGVGWAILTMNCCVWLLDRAGMPRRFGVEHFVTSKKVLKRTLKGMEDIHWVKPNWKRPSRKDGLMPGEEHLDQIWHYARCALSLCAVAVVCLVMVTATHRLTDLDIAQQDNESDQRILQQVMPEAEFRTETPYRSPDAVSISAGYSAANELTGYCIEVQVPGFGGMITMVVGVDLNGTVTGVAVTEHRETLDMGTPALEEEYLKTFIGRSGTLSFTGLNRVDSVSGATVTSKALVTGVNRALAVVAGLESDEDITYADGVV